MPGVRQTKLARQDLAEIARFIAQQSQSRAVALRFLDTITSRGELYAGQPEMGERCPDLGESIRSLGLADEITSPFGLFALPS